MFANEAKAIFDAMLLMFGVAAADTSDFHKQAACMSQNIWFEARGSAFADKLAVGQVVINRTTDPLHADTPCDVIWEPKQFSWTHDGKSDRVQIENKIDRQAWTDSVIAALMASGLPFPDLTSGATHFHAHDVQPFWASAMQPIASYGGHKYYVYDRGYNDQLDVEPAIGNEPGTSISLTPQEQLQTQEALGSFWSTIDIMGFQEDELFATESFPAVPDFDH